MGDLRGRKGRVWEGGHRVPFVARWPENIPASSTSEYTFCFTDLLSTIADLLNEELPIRAGEDSFNMLPALLGKPMEHRPAIIHHSNSSYAMRDGKWKIVFGQGEGRVQPKEGHGYLFDLEADPKELNDLWYDRPDVVEKLTGIFNAITQEGIYPNS